VLRIDASTWIQRRGSAVLLRTSPTMCRYPAASVHSVDDRTGVPQARVRSRSEYALALFAPAKPMTLTRYLPAGSCR
jgi:hypothetical protein